MKNTIKLIVFFLILIGVLIILPNCSNAATMVNDETSLNEAISSADGGTTITLQNDITVTKPIVIQKELIIDGNGHNVVGDPSWTSTSGNQTMFTAQFAEGKLTLKNINLKNGPKYGVQSYDGATVILDNVYITGFKYGGVLANGGKVEVRSLHLGYNGTGKNNGIEIDKGASATNSPTLVMNGILTTDTNENTIYVAENGYLTDFTITNTENTTNKVVLSGNKIALTDKNNNVIAETTIPEKVTPSADIQKLIVSLVVNDKTYKITVDNGEKLTEEMLKSHIKIENGYTVQGFYADADFKTKFDFNTGITKDTTIFAKIEKVQQNTDNNDNKVENVQNVQKDETPKTGSENYLGIALLTLIFSVTAIGIIKNKNKEG